jgi:hypothetical protein
MANDPPVQIHLHGLRNQVAKFEGGSAKLLVGNMWGASSASSEDCVLLTVEGKDANGQDIDIDIEIAVPKSQVRELFGLILDRSGIGNQHP